MLKFDLLVMTNLWFNSLSDSVLYHAIFQTYFKIICEYMALNQNKFNILKNKISLNFL